MQQRRRVAVFGGTFDPPHLGHLVVASEVRFRGRFDELVLMVANDPWQKSDERHVTPADTRLAMVQAAVAGHDGLEAGDLELRRGGATYTIDTVAELAAGTPDTDVTLVLGTDAIAGLDTWHRAAELAELVDIIAVTRPGSDAPPSRPGWRIEPIEVPQVAISSTEIRERCRLGAPIDFLVPDAVRSIVFDRGLYGVRR